MRVVTAAQMKEIERRAAAGGLSYYQMMENAGTAAAAYILKQQGRARSALVAAGKGNNGGDGYVVARLLHQNGISVTIAALEGAPVTEDAEKNYVLAADLGISIVPADSAAAQEAIQHAELIVDAVYGTGFHGALRPEARQLLRLLNQAPGVRYALDLPSGVCADDGTFDPDALCAAATIAFDSLKPAHTDPKAASRCGTVFCADIGIPESCHVFGDA